jgi:membrane-bound lytic murein transglycosylase D
MEEQLSMTEPKNRRHLVALLAPIVLLLGACASINDSRQPSAASEDAALAAAPALPASAPQAVANAASAPGAQAAASAVAEGPAVAEPVDPLRPEEPVNLDEKTASADLWMRVRRGFAMPDLDTDLVRNREQWYATRPNYVQRMTERGSRYLFHIVEEVERRGMPTELALLPFIESAFNPQAISSAKASGMWQFMPATGKDFDLRQNLFRDDRRSVLDSTRAALDYLQRLYGMFGDWHLALAAYNWGEGSVQRAIAKNQRAGLPTDYLSLRMPNETQYYVPKLQAVKNIIAKPEGFGLTLPAVENHPYFLSVPIERDIDVALAVRLSGVSHEEFMRLNPQMNKPVILAAGTPQVLLPYDNASLFVRNVRLHHGPLASWTVWLVPRTMQPKTAAHEVGMSEAALREVNKIPMRMLVRAGSTLLVPRSQSLLKDVSLHVADHATMVLAPEAPAQRRVALRAGKHDSVASVAKRYRVSAAQVAQWNKTGAGATFAPGQTIVVFVPNRSTRAVKPGRTHAKGSSASARKPFAKTSAKRSSRSAKKK